MKNVYIFFLILFSVALLEADEKIIKKKLERILPEDTFIQHIEESEIRGIYKVYFGDLKPIYVSKDGNYFFAGDMFQVKNYQIFSITEEDEDFSRLKIIQNIPEDELIKFASDKELFEVIVFTDISCGWCRKLHSELSEYNKKGISISYAAYPRSGTESKTANKMISAWCSDDRLSSLSKLKNKEKIPNTFCENNPIKDHYLIGQKIGITGTPAIVLPNGELVKGYLSADKLIKRLR